MKRMVPLLFVSLIGLSAPSNDRANQSKTAPPRISVSLPASMPPWDLFPYAGVLHARHSLALQNALFNLDIPTLEVDFNTDSMKFELLGVSGIPFDSIRVLFVPTDGLLAYQYLPGFANSIKNFVSRGGVLVVFTQKNSQAYEVLPRADELTVTGWASERPDAALTYFDTWHSLSCGFGKDQPSLTTRGSVVEAPSDAVWMIRKRSNLQGAAVLYPFGKGFVVIAPAYPDQEYFRGLHPSTLRWLAGLAIWGAFPKSGHEIPEGKDAHLRYAFSRPNRPIQSIVPFLTVYDPESPLKQNILWLDTLHASSISDSSGLSIHVPAHLPPGLFLVRARLLGPGHVLLEDVTVGWLAVRPHGINPENPSENPVRAWFSIRSPSHTYMGDTLWLHVKNLSSTRLILHTRIRMGYRVPVLDTTYPLLPEHEAKFPVPVTPDLPHILGKWRVFDAKVMGQNVNVITSLRINVSPFQDASFHLHPLSAESLLRNIPFVFRFTTKHPLGLLRLHVNVKGPQTVKRSFSIRVDTPGTYILQETLRIPSLAPGQTYWVEPSLQLGRLSFFLPSHMVTIADSSGLKRTPPAPVDTPFARLESWWVDTLTAQGNVGIHIVLRNPSPRSLPIGIHLQCRTGGFELFAHPYPLPFEGGSLRSKECGELDERITLNGFAQETLTLWHAPMPRPGWYGFALELRKNGTPYDWDSKDVFFHPIFHLVHPETLHATMGDRVVIPFTLTNHGTAYAFDTLRWIWGENEEFRAISLWPGDTLQDSFVVFLPPAFVSAVERPYFELAGQTWIMTLQVEGLGVEDSFFVPRAARVGDTVQIRAVLENRSVVPFRGFLTFRYHMQETTLALELSGQKIGFVPVDTALVPQDTPAVWISPILADTVDSVRVSLFGDSLQHVTVHVRRVDTLTPWMPPASLFRLTAYQIRLHFTDTARVDSLILHRYRGGMVRDTLISIFPSPSDTFVWAFVMDTAGPTQDVYLEVDHESGRGVLWTSRKIQVATDSLAVYSERPRYFMGDTLRLVVQTLRPDTLLLNPGVLGETLSVAVPVGADTIQIGRIPPLVSASYPVGYRGVHGDTGRVWVDVEGFKVGLVELQGEHVPPKPPEVDLEESWEKIRAYMLWLPDPTKQLFMYRVLGDLRVRMHIRSMHHRPDSLLVRFQLIQDDTVQLLRDTLIRLPVKERETVFTHTERLVRGHNGPARLVYDLFALPESLRLGWGYLWIPLSGLDFTPPNVRSTQMETPDDTTQPVRLALVVEDESPVTGWFLVRRDTVWDTLQATVHGDTLVALVSGGGYLPVAWFAWLVDREGNAIRWPPGRWPDVKFAYFRRPTRLQTRFDAVSLEEERIPVFHWHHPGEQVIYARGRDERWIVVDTTRTVDVMLLPSQIPAVIEEIRFFGVNGKIRAEIRAGDSLLAGEETEVSREGWKAIPFHVEITDTPVVLRFRGVPDGVLGFVNADRRVVLTGGIAGTPLLSVQYRYPVTYRVERERLAPFPGDVRIWPALSGSPLADTLPGEGVYHYALSLVLPDTTKPVDGTVVTVEREGPWVGYLGSVLDTFSSQTRKVARFRVWDASGVQSVTGWFPRGKKWERVDPLKTKGDTVMFALSPEVNEIWVDGLDQTGHQVRRGPFYPVIHGLSGVLRDTVLTGKVFVTGDVTIPRGAKVVLRRAQIIQAPGDETRSGWRRHRVEWVVRGHLEGQNCTFSSAGYPRAVGIRVEEGTLVLRNCTIDEGEWGVHGTGKVFLQGNRFVGQKWGVALTGGAWTLYKNHFEDVGTAILLTGASPSDRVVLWKNRVENVWVGIRVVMWRGVFWADPHRSPHHVRSGMNVFVHTDTVLVNRGPQPLFFGGNFLGTVNPDSLDIRVVDDEEGVGGRVEFQPYLKRVQ